MSESYFPGRNGRLYHVLIRWFEEQVRSGALCDGDRLPPERKLGEQFGISRTAVREALRALAARGFIESHVGRGTFVRCPVASAIRTTHPPHVNRSEACEALVHVVASMAHLAAERHDEAIIPLLYAHTEEGAHEAFVRDLGRAASNPVLATIAATLVQGRQQDDKGVLALLDLRRVVSCIAVRNGEAARQAVLKGPRAPVA